MKAIDNSWLTRVGKKFDKSKSEAKISNFNDEFIIKEINQCRTKQKRHIKIFLKIIITQHFLAIDFSFSFADNIGQFSVTQTQIPMLRHKVSSHKHLV